jgi:hypothetical protein
VLVVATGAVPSHHRAPIIGMIRAAIGRGPERFDARRALSAVTDAERAALRLAIVDGRPARDAAAALSPGGEANAAPLVAALRRAGAESGGPANGPTEQDDLIGTYLFSEETVAQRDRDARTMVSAGDVAAMDLASLEALVVRLEQAPAEVWGE